MIFIVSSFINVLTASSIFKLSHLWM